jgi:hypothetical protein
VAVGAAHESGSALAHVTKQQQPRAWLLFLSSHFHDTVLWSQLVSRSLGSPHTCGRVGLASPATIEHRIGSTRWPESIQCVHPPSLTMNLFFRSAQDRGFPASSYIPFPCLAGFSTLYDMYVVSAHPHGLLTVVIGRRVSAFKGILRCCVSGEHVDAVSISAR